MEGVIRNSESPAYSLNSNYVVDSMIGCCICFDSRVSGYHVGYSRVFCSSVNGFH